MTDRPMPDSAIDSLSADGAQEFRTWVAPWTPGEPHRPELIRLESGPVLVGLIEARARTVWVNYRAKRRILAGIPQPYRMHLGRACERERRELRALLRDRRTIRAELERAEDRIDAAVKA